MILRHPRVYKYQSTTRHSKKKKTSVRWLTSSCILLPATVSGPDFRLEQKICFQRTWHVERNDYLRRLLILATKCSRLARFIIHRILVFKMGNTPPRAIF